MRAMGLIAIFRRLARPASLSSLYCALRRYHLAFPRWTAGPLFLAKV